MQNTLPHYNRSWKVLSNRLGCTELSLCWTEIVVGKCSMSLNYVGILCAKQYDWRYLHIHVSILSFGQVPVMSAD